MAYQIYEANIDEALIVVAGIVGQGLSFAKKIKTALEQITQAEILL